MLTADEQITARLAKLDSPQRVKWMRRYVSLYFTDLAARSYFRLPYFLDGIRIEPDSEAIDTALRIGLRHQLSGAEIHAAWHEQWKEALHCSVTLGQKLLQIGKDHLDYGGSRKTLGRIFLTKSQNFPPHWPFLGADEYDSLASGFGKARRKRRGKP